MSAATKRFKVEASIIIDARSAEEALFTVLGSRVLDGQEVHIIAASVDRDSSMDDASPVDGTVDDAN